MIIDIEFTYAASIKKRRSRHWTTNSLGGTVRVDVAEVSMADLPVVARYSEPVDTHARRAGRDVYSNVLGWHDGNLVQPLRCFMDGEEDLVRRDGAWLARVAATSRIDRDDAETAGDPFAEWKVHRHVAVTARDEIEQMSPEGEAAREAVVAKVRERAAALVLVDGLLWQAVGEPRLVSEVDFESETGKLVVSASVMPAWRFTGKAGAPVPSCTFRLDQSDLIVRMHDVVLEDRDGEARMPHVVVERPDLLRFRADQACLHHAAKGAVEYVAKASTLADMPLDGLVAFANLRDALPAYGEALAAGAETDDEALAALAEAFARYTSASEIPNALKRHGLTREGLSHMSGFAP